MHTTRHIGTQFLRGGLLSDLNTFQFENLLSLIRRNHHSKLNPQVQAMHILKKNVILPVLDEKLQDIDPSFNNSHSSIIDVVLNISHQNTPFYRAAKGEFLWKCLFEIDFTNISISKVQLLQIISVFLDNSVSQQSDVKAFAKVMRKDMIVNENAIDKSQLCTVLKSSISKKTKNESRYDFHVLVENNPLTFVGDIECFFLVHEQVYCLVHDFETTIVDYSKDLVSFFDKYYFKTPLLPKGKKIVPLGQIFAKCDVYKKVVLFGFISL